MATVRIQVRRGTASQWTSVNPILAAGEMGVESDTNLFKFGNGTSTWTALAYANNSDVAIAEISQDAINTALSMGSGLTKSYNDGTNTIQITVDSDVVALKSYVDSAISNVEASVTGLANTVDSDYIPVSDRGVAGGVASLDNSGLIPNSQIDDTNWATKLHVASVSSGLQIKGSVRVTSTDNFAATLTDGTTDASGGKGVGQYLTASANGALVIDGVTLNTGDRVLLKDQVDGKENGIYTVTNTGGSSAAAVLTRATDADNSVDGEVREGLFAFTQEGTANARDGYVLLAAASRSGQIFQLGTDSLTFSQFTGAIPVNISTGLQKTGDTISVNTSEIATVSYVDGINNALTQITTSHGEQIDAVEIKNNEQDSAIAINTADIATNTASISSIVTVNNTQNTRLTSLEAADVTLGGLLDDANTAIADLETELRGDLAPKNNAEFTGTLDLPSTTTIGTVLGTEIAHLSGVTSGIQTQIDSKASNTDLSDHAADTTSVHGIDDTANLVTLAGTQELTNKTVVDPVITVPQNTPRIMWTGTNKEIMLPAYSGTGVLLETTAGAESKADSAVSTHNNATTSVHGIADTSKLVTTDAQTQTLDGALVISGNLTVNGTTTTVSTANFTTADAMIYLGEGNTGNSVDLGIVSSFDDGTYQHSGIVRDASAGTWKIFKGVTDEPTTTVNFGQGSLDDLAVNNLTAAGVVFTDGTQTKQGVPSITPIVEKTAAFNTSDADYRDQMLEVNHTGGSAVTITVTADGTNGITYPVGTSISITRTNTGSVTVAGSGTTVNATPGLTLRARWSSATLFKRAANTWILMGDLTA